jgi:N-acetylglucosamine-6-phosphate deacetylase
LSKVIIRGGAVVAPDLVIPNGVILIEDGTIAAVHPTGDAALPPADGRGATVIDAAGCTVCPGFIDIHIHGAAGADTMDATPGALQTMAAFAASRGVTGFLPTVISNPLPDMVRACRHVADYIQAQSAASTDAPVVPRGAAVLGINVEGPFLNPAARGAQPESGILSPDRAVLDELLQAGAGHVKIMSVAPEIDGALEIISLLAEAGVVPAIAHTEATYEQTCAAAQAGARLVAHTFNAMRGLHHRAPGTVGAALTLDELACEMIADGVHLHPAVVDLIVRAKGPSRVALVTDAMRAAGMPEGRSELGGQVVIVKDGVARLESGSLAGSTLAMDRAVANVRRFAHVSLAEAVQMASSTPARLIGQGHCKGSLAPGMDADITILGPEGQVVRTIVAGNTVYEGVL